MLYSGNRYLTLAEMTENANYIYSYLLSVGWTPNAICGMLGNMQTESTINPGIWEGLDDTDPANGFGLVQWTPSTKYTDWCTANSLDPTLMDSNLLRILYEVTNSLQWINANMTFEEYTQSTNTPYNLAILFLTSYERPADPNQPQRGTQANYWYNLLTGSNPPSGNYPKAQKGKPFLYNIHRRRFIIK